MKYAKVISSIAFIAFPLACGGDPGTANDQTTGEGSGGDDGSMLGSSGGAGASGATGGTGGVESELTGGASSGGVTGTGAANGTGGDAIGTGGGETGTGGMEAGTGGGSSEALATPSPGCSKGTAGPGNGVVYKAGESWLVFPSKYDGTTPLPVVVGFHGCGSGNKGDANNTEFKRHFDGSEIGDNYVRALPLSIDNGGCYSNAGDMARAKALFTTLVNDYCVDLSRVFAVGHSYGAGFLMGMTANESDFNHFGFRGIAPVAGWEIQGAKVKVPTMYVQGIKDSERSGGDGANVAARVASTNGCGMATAAFPTVACNSSSGGAAVDSGCKLYSGCEETTMWCRHNDQSYGTSYHGIPCFFNKTVYEFFESL